MRIETNNQLGLHPQAGLSLRCRRSRHRDDGHGLAACKRQPTTRTRQSASRDSVVGMLTLNECLARPCLRGNPGPKRDRRIPWLFRPGTMSMAETKSFQPFDRFHGSSGLPVPTSLAVQCQSRMPCSGTSVEFGLCRANLACACVLSGFRPSCGQACNPVLFLHLRFRIPVGR